VVWRRDGVNMWRGDYMVGACACLVITEVRELGVVGKVRAHEGGNGQERNMTYATVKTR
jgi:hypothetical protein